MKKFNKLINDKEKLELKIASLLSKFTKIKGIIITKVDIEQTTDEVNILYKIDITGEI